MFEKILKEILPSNEERVRAEKILKDFIEKLSPRLKKFNAKLVVGGSFAKDTWLRNNFDIDMFVKFPKGSENISDLLEKALKEANLSYSRIHASRDYFRVKFNEYCFELVPVIDVKDISEITHVTDASPFHVDYVISKIKERPELKNEIRVAKYFFKKWGIYGAETSVGGFSGYALELLIIYYGSFERLIREASRWRPKVFIDVEGHYKSFGDAIKALGKDKTRSPIILVDPVDPNRNAASSVTIDAFSKLVLRSRELIENKRLLRERNLPELVTNGTALIEFYPRIRVERDICGAIKDVYIVKAQKLMEFIEKKLKSKGFQIIYSEFSRENFSFRFLVYPKVLPELEVREGPPAWIKENVDKFLSKWNPEVTFVKNGRIFAIIRREKTSIEEVIDEIINESWNLLEEKYGLELLEFRVLDEN